MMVFVFVFRATGRAARNMEDVQVIFQCSLVARPKRVLPHAGETEMAGGESDPDREMAGKGWSRRELMTGAKAHV
jgi:hypothetical protein